MRVLIVEDNPIARIMLLDMLSSRGHQVVAEADDEASALSAYQTHKPDIVTLDLSLGLQSGLTVLQSLRKADPKAKVLIISGNPQIGIRERAIAAGASGFLTKPFDIKELETAVSSLANKS